jgi:polyhydroxyalkanoate synthesis regulator phasin
MNFTRMDYGAHIPAERDLGPQYRAASVLGRLVAEGLLSDDAARECLVEVIARAVQRAPEAHPDGVRMRLHWTMSDARRATELDAHEEERRIDRAHARDIEANALRASAAIRAAVVPLIAARTPRAELTLAAYRAANGRLTAADTEAVVADEITAYMARVRASGARIHA